LAVENLFYKKDQLKGKIPDSPGHLLVAGSALSDVRKSSIAQQALTIA